MRLHRLSATAFGPFAGTVEVDFDRVADNGLFLIRGATGAGKTSLLDAVSFALYADVPGARSKKGLHSDHADRGSVPQVSLDFTAGGRLVRIERSPEFRRPKARGAGETKVPARVVLYEHRHGAWAALSTRHDEVAELIQDLLGLGMEQFSKVVLLPQGDFAAFLSASPEQRRALLERLFDVAPFTGVEDWLALRRKESGVIADQHQAALRAGLAMLVEVLASSGATQPETDIDWSAVPLAELPDRLDDARTRLEGAVATALARLDAARLTDGEATQAHTSAEQLAASRQRVVQARTRLAALDSARDEHEVAVARLDAAARASAVSGDLKAFDRARGALDAAGAEVVSAELGTAQLALVDGTQASLEAAHSQLEAGARTLDEAAHRGGAARELARHHAELLRTAERLRDEHRCVQHSIAAAMATQGDAEEALRAARQALGSCEVSERRLADLSRLHALRAEQAAAAVQLTSQQATLAIARDAAQDLRDRYQALFQARLDGLAAELAERLERGDPCPVCGSTEHPAIAMTAAPVTAGEVAAAEERWQGAARHAATLSESVAGLTAAIAQRETSLAGDDRSVEVLAAALDVAQHDHRDLLAHAATVPALEVAAGEAAGVSRALAEQTAALHDDLTAASTAVASLERDLAAQRAAVAARLEDHRRRCPCVAPLANSDADSRPDSHASSHPDGEPDDAWLDRAVAQHEAVTSAVRCHLEAQRHLSTTRESFEQLQVLVMSALAECGFDATQDARAALLSAQEVTRLRAQVEADDRARAAARAVVDDAALQAAQDAPEPDLPGLAAARVQARAALLEAASAETLVRRTLDGLHRVSTSLAQRCGAVADAVAEHETLRELADVVAGIGANNTLRMRLSAFVLAARLEKVATLANERLATMGDGRYQLRHSDGLAAKGARSGLGLQVHDLWTGQARETSSLSGGESFMASLALALGLADAVREEAGGFDLQTLFVDEGFGTLDDDSLEQVMDVLDGLRSGGRAVGVVSHVPELRTRIPSQVVVDKTERGSTVRLRVADEASPAA